MHEIDPALQEMSFTKPQLFFFCVLYTETTYSDALKKHSACVDLNQFDAKHAISPEIATYYNSHIIHQLITFMNGDHLEG